MSHFKASSQLLHPGTVILRHHGRNKGDPLRDPLELVEGNQVYSVLRNGQETTVSTLDLAPLPRCPVNTEEIASDVTSNQPPANSLENFSPACRDWSTADGQLARSPNLHSPSPITDSSPLPAHEDAQPLRWSTTHVSNW